MTFLQWNINGFYDKLAELQIIIKEQNTDIVALQETRLKNDHTPIVNGFTVYNNNFPNLRRACGGVMLMVKNNLPSEEIIINSNYQVVAATITLDRKICVCSIYLPEDTVSAMEIRNILHQLPHPVILLGDFNAHNVIWGCQRTCRKGTTVEHLLDTENLCFLNDGSPTHFWAATGTFSAIDLTITSANIAHSLEWTVLGDFHGSDHVPIIVVYKNFNNRLHVKPRWNEEFANWRAFQDKIHLAVIDLNENIDEVVKQLSMQLYNAALDTIPRTNPDKNRKKTVPWWSSTVQEAIRNRRRALRTFKRSPTEFNLIEFKKCRAKAKITIKIAKIQCWQSFVASMGPSTTDRELWTKIKRVTGQYKCNQINTFTKRDGEIISEPVAIANAIADQFQSNSSSDSYTLEFLRIKSRAESIDYSNPEVDSYLNEEFNMLELQMALCTCKGKSAGPDGITYSMINKMAEADKRILLKVFNHIWKNRSFPNGWRESIIVPIPKGSNDFRPISLTNCLSKVMEKMVSNRLRWYVEKNSLLTPFQAGFRRLKMALDNILLLQNDSLISMNKRHHTICIFFDLRKAYERVWRHKIVTQLQKWGIGGNMFHFISNFLKDRKFKVQNGSTESREKVQENGVPTGSVLSVILFLIAINDVSDIFEQVRTVKFLMYADDLAIYASGDDNQVVTNNIQETINKLENWAKRNGFEFATDKSKAMHICRRRACQNQQITLGGTPLEFVTSHKFLGMVLDTRFDWKEHSKYLKKKCTRQTNVIKSLANTTWGANRESLIKVCKSLICCRLDYGCQAYGNANKTVLNKLEPLMNQSLRLAIGAHRTSPVESIIAEAGTCTLSLRREFLTLRKGVKIKSARGSPLYSTIESNQQIINWKKTLPQPMTRNLSNRISQFGITLDDIEWQSMENREPWTLDVKNQVRLNLAELKKENTNPQIYKQELRELLNAVNPVYSIYTDGSKNGKRCGFAAVDINGCLVTVKANGDSNIFYLEARAILEAVKIAGSRNGEVAIVSDSLSTLKAVTNLRNNEPTIVQIRNHIASNTTLIWCPSHIGIGLNEEADRQANMAASKEDVDESYVSQNDALIQLKKAFSAKVDEKWSTTSVTNKLRQAKRTIFENMDIHRGLDRKDSVILTRLRIGHTRMTHDYVFGRNDQPLCNHCNAALTVKHILIECHLLKTARNTHKISQDLQEVLKPDERNWKNLESFLKDIGIYNQI